MRTEGVVESTSDDNTAIVSIKRDAACGESCAGCGANCSMRNNSITVINTLGAKEGDRVFVEMNTKIVLKSAFAVYILPLVLFFLGYSMMNFLGSAETISILSGIFLFAAAFIFLHLWDKKQYKKINARVCEIIKTH